MSNKDLFIVKLLSVVEKQSVDETIKWLKKNLPRLEKMPIRKVKCICCHNEFEECFESSAGTSIYESLFNNCTTTEIMCGYGSDYDTEKFTIAICDDCIKTNPDIIRHTTTKQSVKDGRPE